MAAKKKVDFETSMLRLEEIVGLLERSPDLIERLQAVFSKKPEESSTAAVSTEN